MCHSHPLSPEKALLLESTLNAEKTDLATLQALLDQVEGDHPAPWSPQQGWRQFQNAHRDRFPAPLPRKAILWAAALGAAAAAASSRTCCRTCVKASLISWPISL